MLTDQDLLHAKLSLEAGESSGAVVALLQSKLSNTQLEQVFWVQLVFGRTTGIPLVSLITWLRQEQALQTETQDKITLALKSPALTAKIIRWVPWFSLLVAQLFGLNAISVLVQKPIGWAVLLLCGLLSWLYAKWVKTILSVAVLGPSTDAWKYRILGLAVASGSGVFEAKNILNKVANLPPGFDELLHQMLATRLPMASQLNRQGQILDSVNQNSQLLLLEALPIKLLMPMATLMIPQFLLLLVLPQAIAALGFVR